MKKQTKHPGVYRAEDIEWNDGTDYFVRVGRRRLSVVGWVVSQDGTQVQARTEDGAYHPLSRVSKPSSRAGWKVYRADAASDGIPEIRIEPAAWFPLPGSLREKTLIDPDYKPASGSQEEKRLRRMKPWPKHRVQEYAKFLRTIDDLKKRERGE